MTLRFGRVVLLCGLAPTLAAALLSVYKPAVFSHLEHSVYDTMLRAAGTRAPSGRVVIVDVDERSLSTIGQWPWRRDVVGDLIARLRNLGAAAVALDIMFPEPERHDGGGVTPDESLADAVRAGRVVLGYGLTFDEAAHETRTCRSHKFGLAVIHEAEASEAPFFRATKAVCNVPLLNAAADASGFLNAGPDSDGVLRRVPLLMEFNGKIHPALALASVSEVLGRPELALRVAHVNAASLLVTHQAEDGPEADRWEVPLDGKSNLLLRYRGGKRTFPYVSAVDVLTGQVPDGTFAGKLVLIGTTALGTREVVATPLDTLFTGVEVQATVADNLLQQDFLHRPDYGATVETLGVIALGIVAALLSAQFGPAWGALGVLALVAAAWSAAIVLLSTQGVLLSPLFPTLGLTAAFGTMTVAGFVVERRRAQRAGHDTARSQRLMVQSLLSLVEIRDRETGLHSRRIQQYTNVLANAVAAHPAYREYLTKERIELLAALAPLHDIGKVGVPDRVLNKPGRLTDEELAEMRKHPAYGRDAIVNAERAAGARDDVTLVMAKEIVYTHHERWDGTGYPQGLRGADIPIPGRLIAVVDAYDAMRSDRCYHAALSHEEAMTRIVEASGTHFDPAVVEACLEVSLLLERLTEGPDSHD